MEVRKVTPEHLAKELLVPREYIDELLKGKINMSLELARNLSFVFKMPLRSFILKKKILRKKI